MSLQAKVISLIFAVFMAYGAIDYAVQRLLILPSFQALEREEAQKNMDRVLQAIERELSQLLATAGDWAFWDDTYQFVMDRNDAYREANLNVKTLQNLEVDLLYVFDAARQPVGGMAYDENIDEGFTVPEFSAEPLPAGHPLASLPETASEVKGLLTTAHGPILLAAKPVLTSSREGPVRGSMVFGRFLNKTAVAFIAEQTRVQLAVKVLPGEPLGPEEAAVVGELAGRGESLIREGAEVDRVYRVLPDLFGQPALLLRVEVPKKISAEGQAAIHYALLSLLGAGLLILVVLLAGLRYLVLEPTRRLTEHSVAVGQKGDLTARLCLNRRDEFGVLAREFDLMVERLAEARKKLIEQSFQSGIAEMASGVLHNIGNAVTPLKVRVATLSDTVRSAPTADLQMAATELVKGNNPPERRRDLEQFVELAGREIAGVLDKTSEQLAGIGRQVDHVHKILSDQERFSRSARVLEPVAVEELVRESADLLGEELRRGIRLKLDASLRAAGVVLGSRVALQQILVNLLKNAAEAIRETSSPGSGCIGVAAAVETDGGPAVVHLRIKDNGIGIRADHLPHIFERGFSTKLRPSSGLGLHWCAVTTSALGGRLYAESPGPRQGACLHLVLPQAESQQTPLAAAAGG